MMFTMGKIIIVVSVVSIFLVDANYLESFADPLQELGTIADPWAFYTNPEIGDHAEGDLYIPPSVENRRTMLNSAKRWPDGNVPFYLQPIIKQNKRAYKILLNAMRLITKYTDKCIEFYPITLEHIQQYPDLIYVNITGDQDGCFSELGQRYKITATRLNLNIQNCFHLPGHAIHELCHVLGQIHEHMRPDRDQFVKINWDNIDSNKHDNFQLMKISEVSSFDYPYDYDSITHYHRTAFAKDPTQPTIIPLNESATIGQRTHLSTLDVKKLIKAYECDKKVKKAFNITDYLTKSNLNKNPTTEPSSNMILETKRVEPPLMPTTPTGENFLSKESLEYWLKSIMGNRFSYKRKTPYVQFSTTGPFGYSTSFIHSKPTIWNGYKSENKMLTPANHFSFFESVQQPKNEIFQIASRDSTSMSNMRLSIRLRNGIEKKFCFNPNNLNIYQREIVLRECGNVIDAKASQPQNMYFMDSQKYSPKSNIFRFPSRSRRFMFYQ